ncbi:hypothetical protein TRICHSKD4_1136 [Roseibium sp. TrichSKD4]|nr:hypothetical protein TRICHSKD4_1136 [Roseibium sp. TrichSKD4]
MYGNLGIRHAHSHTRRLSHRSSAAPVQSG